MRRRLRLISVQGNVRGRKRERGAGRVAGRRTASMAGVAQLVERQVVVLDAVGSSPIARPSSPLVWWISSSSKLRLPNRSRFGDPMCPNPGETGGRDDVRTSETGH